MNITSSASPARANVLVDAGEAQLEGESHVVGERKRRRTGSTLAAVDRDEVRSAARERHPLGEPLPEAALPDRGLDAHRKARLTRDRLDELDQAVDV
jgi:hypothetical protein